MRDAEVVEHTVDISEDRNMFWLNVAEVIGKVMAAVVKMCSC